MNKKIVSSLFLLPVVLASCHGQTISRGDALEIVDNIEKSINEKLPFSVFSFVINIDEENNKTTTKHFFDITNKYYYTYSCVNGAVNEDWNYVKSDDNEEEQIYTVSRIIDSSINDELTPRYASSFVEYDEKVWEELELHYVTILTRETFAILNSIKSYLDSEPGEGSSLTLESYGSHDLYIRRTIVDQEGKQNYEKEAEFADSCLISYSYKAESPLRNRSYSVSYSSVEIFYPKID